MKLIIVESPHKAKTIAKYLGSGYRVVASKGHVSDLPQKTMGIDVKTTSNPSTSFRQKKKPIIDMIKKDIQHCDAVYLAGDPDREGEAISWHLANVCDIKEKKVRIVFNEISKKAVQKSVAQSPRNQYGTGRCATGEKSFGQTYGLRTFSDNIATDKRRSFGG